MAFIRWVCSEYFQKLFIIYFEIPFFVVVVQNKPTLVMLWCIVATLRFLYSAAQLIPILDLPVAFIGQWFLLIVLGKFCWSIYFLLWRSWHKKECIFFCADGLFIYLTLAVIAYFQTMIAVPKTVERVWEHIIDNISIGGVGRHPFSPYIPSISGRRRYKQWIFLEFITQSWEQQVYGTSQTNE